MGANYRVIFDRRQFSWIAIVLRNNLTMEYTFFISNQVAKGLTLKMF